MLQTAATEQGRITNTPNSNLVPTQQETPSFHPPPDIDPDEDIAWLNALENDELEASVNVCVERWKSASPEAQKKMFALFAIAGVFVAICRHGHVLLICDMIRSGEL